MLQQSAAAQTASIARCSSDLTSQQSGAYLQQLSKQENSCVQNESKVTHRTIKGKDKKVKYVLFIHYLIKRPYLTYLLHIREMRFLITNCSVDNNANVTF